MAHVFSPVDVEEAALGIILLQTPLGEFFLLFPGQLLWLEARSRRMSRRGVCLWILLPNLPIFKVLIY